MHLILTLAVLLPLLLASCSSNKKALEGPFRTIIPGCSALGSGFSQSGQWTERVSKEYTLLGAFAHARVCDESGVKLTILILSFASDAEAAAEFTAQTGGLRAQQHRDASGSNFEVYAAPVDVQSSKHRYATDILFQVRAGLASVVAEHSESDPLPPQTIAAVARASDLMDKALVAQGFIAP